MPDVGPHPKSNPRDFKYPMCSGMLYRKSVVKSVALSREDVVNWEVEAIGELKIGSVEVVVGARTDGVVEANRMPAPFCIKVFVLENWDLVVGRRIDELALEWSGLDRIEGFCTAENFR